MAVGFLVDTNIFLEILLLQNKKEECKSFLQSSSQPLFISDFSLHSIGVILFNQDKQNIYTSFCEDVFRKIRICTLSHQQYYTLEKISADYQLDFDDSYQLLLAKTHDYKIITMDQDFRNINPELTYFL